MLTDSTIKLILGYVGIKKLNIECERPDMLLDITFEQYGQPKRLKLTLKQVIDSLCNGVSANANGSKIDELKSGGG